MEVPAGVWVRGLAFALDTLVQAPIIAISVLNFYIWKSLAVALMTVAVGPIYKVLLEWRCQATLGKKWLRIRIVPLYAESMTLWRSALRNSPFILASIAAIPMSVVRYTHPAFLSGQLPVIEDHWTELSHALNWLWIGSFLSAATNRPRCAIHDYLAATVCLRTKRPSYSASSTGES